MTSKALHFLKSTSGAPFTINIFLLLIKWIEDINFLSESKGISPILLNSFFKFKIEILLSKANCKIAISVGSPIANLRLLLSGFSSITASVHKAALINISFLFSLIWMLSSWSFSVHNLVTVILFIVKVPVLSEQITEVEPNVSTDGSFLINACFLVISLTPIDKIIVTIAVNPSGIAIAAKEIANNKEDWIAATIFGLLIIFSITNKENKKVIKVKTIPKIPNHFPNFCNFNCNGDNICWLSFNKLAILPISVLLPIA